MGDEVAAASRVCAGVMGRAVGPQMAGGWGSWGVAPGWYGARRWRWEIAGACGVWAAWIPKGGIGETVFVPLTTRVEVHPFGVRFGVRFQEPVFSPDLRFNILCFALSRRTIDNWFQQECRPGRYGKSR